MSAAPLWLTAREIAEARLPGLPTSPRGVKLLAERGAGPNAPASPARVRAGAAASNIT